MIPGDRLICLFIDDFKAGQTFHDWPLHITIVPWFRTQPTTGVLSIAIQEKLAGIEPFTANIGEEAGFGHKGKKLVNLVDLPSPLQKIEHIARDVLHAAGSWIVDETTQQKRPFRPHVTVQGSNRLHKGDTVACKTLYIVEQQGEHKEIVDKIIL